MSAAEARTATGTVRPAVRRRVSTRLLRSEVRLIAGRRRNQMGLLVLALVPVVLALAYLVMLALGPDGRPTPGGGRQPRGVGRALASVRRLQAAAPTKTGAGR